MGYLFFLISVASGTGKSTVVRIMREPSGSASAFRVGVTSREISLRKHWGDPSTSGAPRWVRCCQLPVPAVASPSGLWATDGGTVTGEPCVRPNGRDTGPESGTAPDGGGKSEQDGGRARVARLETWCRARLQARTGTPPACHRRAASWAFGPGAEQVEDRPHGRSCRLCRRPDAPARLPRASAGL